MNFAPLRSDCSDLPESQVITACDECEDEKTMEYTKCGSCDATCDDPNPICTQVCVEKCQC